MVQKQIHKQSEKYFYKRKNIFHKETVLHNQMKGNNFTQAMGLGNFFASKKNKNLS